MQLDPAACLPWDFRVPCHQGLAHQKPFSPPISSPTELLEGWLHRGLSGSWKHNCPGGVMCAPGQETAGAELSLPSLLPLLASPQPLNQGRASECLSWALGLSQGSRAELAASGPGSSNCQAWAGAEPQACGRHLPAPAALPGPQPGSPGPQRPPPDPFVHIPCPGIFRRPPSPRPHALCPVPSLLSRRS